MTYANIHFNICSPAVRIIGKRYKSSWIYTADAIQYGDGTLKILNRANRNSSYLYSYGGKKKKQNMNLTEAYCCPITFLFYFPYCCHYQVGSKKQFHSHSLLYLDFFFLLFVELHFFCFIL